MVVLDPDLKMAIDVFPCEDGHAQERSLFESVLQRVKPGELWIADRALLKQGMIISKRNLKKQLTKNLNL